MAGTVDFSFFSSVSCLSCLFDYLAYGRHGPGSAHWLHPSRSSPREALVLGVARNTIYPVSSAPRGQYVDTSTDAAMPICNSLLDLIFRNPVSKRSVSSHCVRTTHSNCKTAFRVIKPSMMTTISHGLKLSRAVRFAPPTPLCWASRRAGSGVEPIYRD